MPRKPTIQPEPLNKFTLPDGTLVEVRDEDCWEIGRGQQQRSAHVAMRDKILVWVVDQYLDAKGPKDVEVDILKSASVFDRALQRSGLLRLDGYPDLVRKKIYHYVVAHLVILKRLVEEKNKPK